MIDETGLQAGNLKGKIRRGDDSPEFLHQPGLKDPIDQAGAEVVVKHLEAGTGCASLGNCRCPHCGGDKSSPSRFLNQSLPCLALFTSWTIITLEVFDRSRHG